MGAEGRVGERAGVASGGSNDTWKTASRQFSPFGSVKPIPESGLRLRIDEDTDWWRGGPLSSVRIVIPAVHPAVQMQPPLALIFGSCARSRQSKKADTRLADRV